MTELRLQGHASTLVTSTDAWHDVLRLAEGFGWRPERARVLYRADVGLEVTEGDAGHLAHAFEKLADHISTDEPEIDDVRRDRILRDLNRLIAFCRGGQFRIC